MDPHRYGNSEAGPSSQNSPQQMDRPIRKRRGTLKYSLRNARKFPNIPQNRELLRVHCPEFFYAYCQPIQLSRIPESGSAHEGHISPNVLKFTPATFPSLPLHSAPKISSVMSVPVHSSIPPITPYQVSDHQVQCDMDQEDTDSAVGDAATKDFMAQSSENEWYDDSSSTETSIPSESGAVLEDPEAYFDPQQLQTLHETAKRLANGGSVEDWVTKSMNQLNKEKKQCAKDPVKLKEILPAKRELASVARYAHTRHLTGIEFMQGLCCPHLLERNYFSKPSFDKFANGKLWVHYTDSTGRQLREHVDGWAEMMHMEAWILAWEYPRYFIPGRFFTRKQSDEESLREFLIVRKEFLLLELFIRANQGAQSALIDPISVALAPSSVDIADKLPDVVLKNPWLSRAMVQWFSLPHLGSTPTKS